MTKTKKIIIGTIISIGALGGLMAYAAPGSLCEGSGGMFAGKHNGMRGDFIAKRLNLDDIQKQNLEYLKNTMMEQMQPHKDNHPREKIMELLSEPTLDQAKALSMLEQRGAAMKESAPTVIAAIATFTDSLSDEQRTEIRSMMDQFKQHRGGPFGRHMGKHMGGPFGSPAGNGQPNDAIAE